MKKAFQARVRGIGLLERLTPVAKHAGTKDRGQLELAHANILFFFLSFRRVCKVVGWVSRSGNPLQRKFEAMKGSLLLAPTMWA